MCGIAGLVRVGDRATLERMTAALAHRGPDGAGHWVDPELPVMLGHRRLAVIDPAGGAQPMWDPTGRIGVVFNGEIYNHVALRRELEAGGARFRSDHSDTEVLLHGWLAWKEGLPEKLDGMFAFVLLDRQEKRLFLARDRMGEKPLYYYMKGEAFAFASELGAFRAVPELAPRVRTASLIKLLAHGFLPAPAALYEHTAKLPAGCRAVYDLATGALAVSRWYRFAIEPDPALAARPEAELAAELLGLLAGAVRRRMVSDVPLGVLLSGGVDSSAMLALARRAEPRREIPTFTVGFTDPSYDESVPARRVATALGSVHHERILDLAGARDSIPRVLGLLDEPLADPSIIPTYLLCAFARKEVTVALGGDGGDELFAGYDPFLALGPAGLYHRLVPAGLHRLLRTMAGWLPVSDRNMGLDFKLRRTLRGLSQPPELWNPVWLGPLEPAELGALFGRPVDPEEVYAEALEVWRGSATGDLVDRTLEFFTILYLQDDILAKVDRASMMVSLEVRAPFLDPAVLDFARRLPRRAKLAGRERKVLLRKALRGVVPTEALDRPKKGFGMPVARWLRELPEPPRHPVEGIDPAFPAARLAEHKSGRADHRLFLWAWTALQHHLGAAP